MKYVIPTKVCEKCGQEFDWIYGVCPKCYPNGYIDAIREITSKLKQPKELQTMSTSPVTTEQPTTNAVHTSAHYTSENYTLEVGYTKEELAKPEAERKLKAYPEGTYSDEEKEKGEFQVVFTQTFVHYSPVDLDGVGELIPDDDEVLNLITAQLKVKLVNRARSQATSKDFKPVDGVIDMFDECNKKSERRLSQFEKTTQTILKDFTPEMQARLLELLKAQQTV